MKMNNFLQRTLTGAVFAVIVIGAVVWHSYSFLGLLALICLFGLWEFIKLFPETNLTKSARILTIASGFMVFVCATTIVLFNLDTLATDGLSQRWLDLISVFISNRFFLVCCWLTVSAMILFFIASKTENAFKTVGYIVLSWFYISIPLAAFASLHGAGRTGYELPLSVIFMVWASDTFAYITGKLIGKHRIAPSISPGKTWEGFFGGIVFTSIVSVILSNFNWLPFETAFAIFVGIAISISGFVGDLAESYLKRKADVKDSGNILPGHGGILDRFDALLFAAPVFYLIYTVYLQFQTYY